jgi:molybdate transport system substrate-binding protein
MSIVVLMAVLCLSPAAFAGEINLSVAASLKEVINELSDSFARKNPGAKFLKNYGGSGALAKQIENGAPADIFISANLEWLEYLKNKKLLESTGIAAFAYNTLVFAGNPATKVAGMRDLEKLDRIAIGSPKSVPAGEYAYEALKQAGIEKRLEKKLVLARDVRECLMYVERGEADGAFVYRTDALQARQARLLFTVPQGMYPRVTYPMGLTLSGAHNRDATAFYRYLRSSEARAVLIRHGFAVK